MSQLKNIIPLKFLPEEYGGTNGCLDQSVKEYSKKWPDYVEYFKQNSQYGTAENLRPGKLMDFDGLFWIIYIFKNIFECEDKNILI